MTHHPAAAVAVLSAAAAASYMNLNLRNSLVLHSSGVVGQSAFVADQAPAVTPDVQQHDEFVFMSECRRLNSSACSVFLTHFILRYHYTCTATVRMMNVLVAANDYYYTAGAGDVAVITSCSRSVHCPSTRHS